MSYTFTQLQTEVQGLVIDLPTFVQSRVPNLVNWALRNIQSRHNFNVQKAITSTLVSAADTRVLAAVPSNFKEFRGKPRYVRDSGLVREMRVLTENRQIQRQFGEDDTGYPRYIALSEPTDELGAQNFEIWPLSDGNSDYSDGEYRIVIPYWKYVAALSAGGDNNWFTNNDDAALYIIYKATSQAFASDWDEERAAFWNAMAEPHYLTVSREDKHKALSGIDALVPHLDAREPWTEE